MKNMALSAVHHTADTAPHSEVLLIQWAVHPAAALQGGCFSMPSHALLSM